jgi:hypothetical protein
MNEREMRMRENKRVNEEERIGTDECECRLSQEENIQSFGKCLEAVREEETLCPR